jgi:transcriptional regulator with XRE-family HTH domain
MRVVGKNIKARRKELGVSRDSLVRMMGLLLRYPKKLSSLNSYLRCVENGSNMHFGRLLLIADLLNMAPSELLDGVDSLTEWLERDKSEKVDTARVAVET